MACVECGAHGELALLCLPEAVEGGPIAFVKTGDRLIIDAANRRIDHDISDAELARRKEGWAPPPPRVTRGVLANYYKSVASPKHGCVTDMI